MNPSTDLPPSISIPAVNTVAAELAKLTDEHTVAAEKLRQLEEARSAAADADTAAYGKALRSGKPDPGAKHVERVDAEMSTARRRAEALAAAVIACEAELRAAVEKARAEWARQLDEQASTARQACRDAVDALDEAMTALRTATGTASWLAAFPERTRYRSGGALYAPGTASRNGEPLPLTVVLDALRQWAEPPAAAPVAPVPAPSFRIVDVAS